MILSNENQALMAEINALKKEISDLKEINRNKAQWLAILAHDFKGVFSNTIWVVNAFQNEEISRDMLLELLPDLKESAMKSLNALNDTFTAARIQQNNFQIVLENQTSLKIFNDIEKHLEDQLKKKDLKFIFQGDMEASVRSNPLLIVSLFIKIVDNAIKFSNPGSKILFVAKKSSPDKIRIIIEDFGIGMNRNTLDTVFSLYRSPYMGTQEELGTGLGLILVREILKIINGEIEMQSIENVGTKVIVTI